MRNLCLLFLLLVALLTVRSTAVAKVRAVSTDGEATVYVTQDFTGDFDVSYEVHFPPSSGNRSWSVISLLLLGRVAPSGSCTAPLAARSNYAEMQPRFPR